MSGRGGTRTIRSRETSVTNAFVQSILPDSRPDPEEERAVLAFFGQRTEQRLCVYCGAPGGTWDHLYAYVKDKRPSGYINSAWNRVPACSDCNSAKGSKHWRDFLRSGSKKSPRGRGCVDMEERIAKLEAFEGLGRLRALDIEALAPADIWESYWRKRDAIEAMLKEADLESRELRRRIQEALDRSVANDPA
ncbi:MAG: HNH endonuclease signature motif containing protein [Sphingopyxis sp.]|uniref:HNH endonuclease signature motif containing protein n=1 Tax=Sphingopyxis sp. TaxID=1908224 RepID=UPI002ABCEE17|nr:HNH endonuclease signature motif containing protein [Sphingopyxis sp.]MDZ3830748.1 HNH endonuclease signature motif containing protein [Sphingopyxis sp.]